ncbi:Acetyltransferase (GNAT) family protein [Arboricoccus pini]|uniref:Acetyltransferase (GNAT) family protein n=1 Tax=Arboricoccus pini TaxID=1963835 RepID=A0A212QRE3_9PROT|nr:GNAT family N-acetyltransferase [Arboricoccus pini]SNB62145.1 Acetyltransferase (GNAT) family protein [Arboricoccus pini]
MIDASRLRQLERTALLAWPPATLEVIDGWQVRRDADISKRCNACSASFPYVGPYAGRDVGTSIARVEAWYRGQGNEPLFQLTAAAEPCDLAIRLDQAGYRCFGTTSVMTRPVQPPLAVKSDVSILLEGRPTQLAMAGLIDQRWPAGPRTARAALFNRVRLPMVLAVAILGDRPVGGGYAAIDRETVFLASIRVEPAHRGRRIGRAVLARLLAWAAGMGAKEAMLQVERENATARALYEQAGFSSAYDYWYHRPN